MVVEFDFWGFSGIVLGLLHVYALVHVVQATVLAVDSDAVELVVGVLDVYDAAVVLDVLVSLENGTEALALDDDVRVTRPGKRNSSGAPKVSRAQAAYITSAPRNLHPGSVILSSALRVQCISVCDKGVRQIAHSCVYAPTSAI